MVTPEVTYSEGEWELYLSCCDFADYYDPGHPIFSWHETQEAALQGAADHVAARHASLA